MEPTTTRRGLLARLLRLDARHRAARHASITSEHMRRDMGLPPFEAPPRNPFTSGW